jgi:hypothetical protein
MSHRLLTLPATCAALALSCAANAATPASGTITPDAPSLSFSGGPFVFPNITTQGEVHPATGGPICESTPGVALICDTFALKLDLPADYYATNPQATMKIQMTWDAPTGQEDYDFYIKDASGAIIHEGEGTTNPENMVFCAGQGMQDYTIEIIPWNAMGDVYNVTVDLVEPPSARCKEPKAAAAGKSGQFGGALGFALLLPLIGYGALRRRVG